MSASILHGIVPPRRYTIDELLEMKSSLPYVACPVEHFKPDAWKESLIKSSILPPHLAPKKEEGSNNPKKTQSPLKEPSVTASGTVMPLDLLMQSFYAGAAFRQPFNPTFGPPSVQGFHRSFSTNTHQRLLGSSANHGIPMGGYQYAGSAASCATYMTPNHLQRKPRYNTGRSTLENNFTIEDLQNMAIHSMHTPRTPAVVVTEPPFPSPEFSGGYGAVPASNNAQSSQGFVPGGKLKSAPVAALTPTAEHEEFDWNRPSSSAGVVREDHKKYVRTNNSCVYEGVATVVQPQVPRVVTTEYKENSLSPDVYSGIVELDKGKVTPIQAPVPPPRLLGTSSSASDQMAFIEYMIRQPIRSRSRATSMVTGGSINGSEW